MKIGIIGLGWYGSHLATKLSAKHQVHGTRTDANLRQVNRPVPVFPLRLDPKLETEDRAVIFNADCLVVNIPPARLGAGSEDYYTAQMEALSNAVEPSVTSHLIFVSSTGVYGDHQERVDEDTQPEPTSSSGNALLKAESYLVSKFPGRVSIIRPAGLVGEDRHPAKYLAGRKGVSGRLHPVNLVHRKDLILLTEAIIENPPERRVFHAVAAQHPSKEAYYSAAARAMGLEAPEFDLEDTSQGKFVDGEKSKKSTGVQFKFNDPYEMF